MQHANLAVGDVLELHDAAMGLDVGALFDVTGKSDWQVHAKHRGTGKAYKFGNNGLRYMTAHRKTGKAKASEAMSNENAIKCRAAHGVKLEASEPWESGQPVQFIYAPEGMHTITAGFRKAETITISVMVDEPTVQALQESFDHLTATMPKQEPYADEDHESKKATLRFPAGQTHFSWGVIKGAPGIIVSGCYPTSYGAEAVNGKVYRAWSPEFSTDAEMDKAKCSKDGHWTFPDGVRGSESNPARLVEVNFVVGALTNRPAFRAMPPVKAKQAEVGGKETVKAVESEQERSEAAKKGWEHRHGGVMEPSEKLHDVLLVDDKGSPTSTQIWEGGTHGAAKWVLERHERGSGGEDKWYRPVVHAFVHSTEHGTTHHYDMSDPSHVEALKKMAYGFKMHASDAGGADTVQAAGTSEGVRKGWETRARHHNSLAQNAQMDFQATAHQASEAAYKASRVAELDKDDAQESHIVAEGKHREANRQHYGAARKTDEGALQQEHFKYAREHLGMAEYHREKAAGHAKASDPTVLDTLKASQDSALDLLEPQRQELRAALGGLKPCDIVRPQPPPPPPDEPAEPTNSAEALDYIKTSRECPKRVREREAVLDDLRKGKSEETKTLSRVAQAGAPR